MNGSAVIESDADLIVSHEAIARNIGGAYIRTCVIYDHVFCARAASIPREAGVVVESVIARKIANLNFLRRQAKQTSQGTQLRCPNILYWS